MLNVLHQTAAGLEWEIRDNQPGTTSVSEVSKTHPGIVTVTDRASGKFIYKLRPGSATSIVFGTLGGKDVECVIRDGSLSIGGVTLRSNQFQGGQVGVHLSSNGALGIGGGRLPEPIMRALRDARAA